MGASKIIVSDLVDNRLQVAKELGADHILKVDTSATVEDLAKQVAQILGVMPDASIECSGAETSVKLAILVCISIKLLLINIYKLNVCIMLFLYVCSLQNPVDVCSLLD